MSKMNLLSSIQIYQDPSPTNNPLQSTANWTSSNIGVEVNEPETRNLKVAGNQSEVLFSGVVETDVDNTTTFDLIKKLDVSATYILKHNSGTAPNFRTDKDIGGDATTQYTITKSGSLLTFTYSGGLSPDFSNLQFGDEVRLGTAFDMFNRGVFKLLNSSIDSFVIENMMGVGEVVTLGADPEEQLSIYSSEGVQKGQKIKIEDDFASYSHGVYEITDVYPNAIEFNIAKDLPQETDILSNVVVYKNSKSFIYLEYDKKCSLIINGVEHKDLKPLQIGAKKNSGIFMRTGDMYSAIIKNETTDVMSVLVISAE